MTRAIDFSALLEPATREQVRAFRVRAKTSGELWVAKTGTRIGATTALIVFAAVFLVIFGNVFFTIIRNSFGNSTSNPTGFIIFAALFGGLVILAIVAAARGTFGNARWERWMRLSRFAAANDMTFSPEDKNPAYPGLIFDRGGSRAAYDHLMSASGRFFDLGNYRWVTRSGENSTTHTRGFLAFHLDRRLPHMVLDATANNGLFGGSNLGIPFAKDQVLSLEGDFDRYFTLYCPREYERDALYVFTPDLMALLIDEASPFDVEIVDDWMFVYSDKPFTPAEPAVYQRLFRILDTVGAKTITQTDRYADERIGDRAVNLVAPQGRRLTRGVSVFAIVAVVGFVVYWAWSFFGALLNF